MHKTRLITRAVWILSFVSMFADVASEMLYPIIPVYLRNIGFSMFLIGLLEGIAEATSGLSKGYFGNWSDRLGKRMPFVRLGYLLAAITKPLMVLFAYPVWIFFVRTTDRIGKGLRTAPRDALLSDEATAETKAAVFSFHRGWDTLGAVAGPSLALAYLYYYPGQITTLFIIAFVPGIIAVGLTFLIKEKTSIQKSAKHRPGLLSFVKYWKAASPEYRNLLIPLLVFALFNSSDMLLLLKVNEATGSANTAIWVYVFYNFVYALLSYPLGLIAMRFNMKFVFLFGMALYTVTYFGMATAASNTSFFIIFGIYGMYMAATEGISKAWISNLIPKEHTSTGIGLFVAFQSIALMFASAFAGLMWSLFGASVAFFITAIISLLVFIYMLLFVKKPR